MKFKKSQIEFIEMDLGERGISFDPLREDLVDHICCEVEKKMDEGMSFMDAYHSAIHSFKRDGLPELNAETTTLLNSITMIRSYIKLTFRNIFKYKVFSSINILGLSLGMSVFFIILQYVAFELSFDRFHPRSSSIYRLTQNTIREGGQSFHSATTLLPVASLVKEEYAEIEDYSCIYFLDRHAVVSYEERKFEQEGVMYGDPNFFQFFSYNLIKGNAADVLREINSVVISESAALRYFDKTDPIGKIIKLSEELNDMTLLVTGVFKDPPTNSHLKPHMVVSMLGYEQLADVKENLWNWPFYMSYVRLREGADPEELEQKLPGFVSKYFPRRNERQYILSLQPLEDIHLYSKLEYEIEMNGNAQLVFLLLGVAILTLIVAYANYINLSTARSLERAKEVGVRKTLGSMRLTLVKQFLTEATTINLIALALAVVLLRIFTLFFLGYAGISIDLTKYNGPFFWGLLGVLFIVGALLSSLYPAFVLSSFQPIAALRGRLNYSISGQLFRRSLVLFQFVASISLMIAAYAIYSQVQYMRSQPLGMDINNLLVVKGPRINNMGKVSSGEDPFVTKSIASMLASNASVSSSVPGVWTSRISNITRQGSQEGKSNSYNLMSADDRFIDTYKLQLIAGRYFQSNIDTAGFSTVIINERAAEQLGFASPQEAVNSVITFRGKPIDVIGVIKDYHHFSLKAVIDPLVLYPIGGESKEFYSIRLSPDARPLSQAISEIEKHWKSVYPDNPFEYFFLDSFFNAQYKSELQFEKIFTSFSLLTVFIAFLGLYGLTSFVIMKRTKEIGIRKILGSSMKGIVLLLLSDFSKLIAVAGLIALPLAYVGIQNWQSQFAFREILPWWIYLLPMGIVLLIAVLTISIHAIKVAKINPVKILKYD